MIGFRVDANEYVATGHLMRCISIALQCEKLGEKCIFLMAEEKGIQYLQDRGISYRILHTQWNCMDTEIDVMKKVIQEEELKWLVVDSYQVSASYLAVLQQLVPVLYVDDLQKEMYSSAAILCYIKWPENVLYRTQYADAGVQVLAGMQYAPLREEFCMEDIEREREKSILITTGGTDTYNVSGRVLKYCLGQLEFAEYHFHVIVGSMNENEPELQSMAERNPRIRLHKNVSRMSNYMRSCRYAVSAGGTTMLELCACKIPTVCFSFADNQSEFVQDMDRKQIMLFAGDARVYGDIEKRIGSRLLEYIKNPALAAAYAEHMANLVDGSGSRRVAEFLLGIDGL